MEQQWSEVRVSETRMVNIVSFSKCILMICTHRGLWGLVVIWLLWLSGRALAAQTRGVLGSTPGSCRLFTFLYFHLITSKFIYTVCVWCWGSFHLVFSVWWHSSDKDRHQGYLRSTGWRSLLKRYLSHSHLCSSQCIYRDEGSPTIPGLFNSLKYWSWQRVVVQTNTQHFNLRGLLRESLLWNGQEKLYFPEKSCVLPKRLESRLDFVPWASSFTFLTQANKAKVLYGIPRDPDVAAALAELEEEENEGNAEDEKPKVGCDCDLTVTCMILHLKVMW